jgi:5-methylcytosine-specific restriction protein A
LVEPPPQSEIRNLKSEIARPSAAKRGYNTRWQKARQTFLARNALCAICKSRGKVSAATVVDHIVPHRGDTKRFWDKNNWQPLCTRCHNAKTRRGE